jgi:hypothetical protein
MRLRVEGICLDNIGTGVQIFFMNAFDDIGLRYHQQVVIAFQIVRPVFETFATVIGFAQLMPLYHGTHCAVDNKYTFLQAFLDRLHTKQLKGYRA